MTHRTDIPARRSLALAAASLALLSVLASCGGGGGQQTSGTVSKVDSVVTVKGVSFVVKTIPGTAFTMGSVRDYRKIRGIDQVHQVLLDGYAIMDAPVSQALWEAVMGGNPSSTLSPGLPVDRVSAKDAAAFAKKISKLTGIPFTLPSEAQWEFAAKTGAVGVVDNLREWCADSFTEEVPSPLVRNPLPTGGGLRVVRSLVQREGVQEASRSGALSFRLAVGTDEQVPDLVLQAMTTGLPRTEQACSKETVVVNGVPFGMLPVEGGTLRMGSESGNPDELPVRDVSVESFELGATEVTVAQWTAVVGYAPFGNDPARPDDPVINVSWYAAEDFCLKLRALTGRGFRLPTEAEWEWAAGGGRKSRGLRYSGSQWAVDVAAHVQNRPDRTVARVGMYRPNELGLYDMSGNAWEWCSDRYSLYGAEPEPTSDVYVQRGGSAASNASGCRVTNRASNRAFAAKGTYGLRVAI